MWLSWGGEERPRQTGALGVEARNVGAGACQGDVGDGVKVRVHCRLGRSGRCVTDGGLWTGTRRSIVGGMWSVLSITEDPIPMVIGDVVGGCRHGHKRGWTPNLSDRRGRQAAILLELRHATLPLLGGHGHELALLRDCQLRRRRRLLGAWAPAWPGHRNRRAREGLKLLRQRWQVTAHVESQGRLRRQKLRCPSRARRDMIGPPAQWRRESHANVSGEPALTSVRLRRRRQLIWVERRLDLLCDPGVVSATRALLEFVAPGISQREEAGLEVGKLLPPIVAREEDCPYCDASGCSNANGNSGNLGGG